MSKIGPKRVRTHVNPLSITREVHFSGFDNNHPILVDVGAYKGEFVEALLEKFPQKNFILFEIRMPVANFLRKKFIDFSQVAIFDGDAGRNFRRILEPCQMRGAHIEEIFINFPDPWPKERHKKRRFLNPELINNCKNWLNAGAKWYFQTDQKSLFEETVLQLREEKIPPQFFDRPIHDTMTDWEAKKTADGFPIFRLKFSL